MVIEWDILRGKHAYPMNKLTTYAILCCLPVAFSGCKKDVLLDEQGGSLSIVFDRGDISNVGANDHRCYFTQGSEELVIHDLWDSSFTFLNTLNSPMGEIPDLKRVSGDTVVISDLNRGLYYYDGSDLKFYSKQMFGIMQFDKSCDLIGTMRSGVPLYKFPGQQVPLSVLERDDGIVLCIAACNDIAYVGYDNIGVFKVAANHNVKARYNASNTDLTSSTIRGIGINGDDVWILTNNELAVVRNDVLTCLEQPTNVTNKSLYLQDGVLLVNTTKGVYKLNDDQLIPMDGINAQLPDPDHINDISVSPNGHIWIGTKKGLYRYRP